MPKTLKPNENGASSAAAGEAKITHPTSITDVRLSDGTLTMRVSGFPWWQSHAEDNDKTEACACMEFQGVSRARLTENWFTRDPFHEDLETFAIADVAEETWNEGTLANVYCSMPVADPLAVVTALETFLHTSECPIDRSEFLHESKKLEAFVEMCRSDMFLIASGPTAVCKVVSKELGKLGVRHSITTSDTVFAKGILVTWWDGFLICETATMSWEQS